MPSKDLLELKLALVRDNAFVVAATKLEAPAVDRGATVVAVVSGLATSGPTEIPATWLLEAVLVLVVIWL